MNDQEWLRRVKMAAEIYIKDCANPEEIETFIKWLYKQYGIVYENRML